MITLHGESLTAKDREDLLRIANKCPVHKTLENASVVTTVLAAHEESAKLSNPVLIPPKESTLPGNFPINRVLPFSEKRLVGPCKSISSNIRLNDEAECVVCFCDHFGPIDVTDGSMDIGPHPHIGLSTLTFLYEGAMIHRDSTGADVAILPGEVNLMTSGKGAVHSERGNEALHLIPDKDGRKWLHGLQMWVALPAENESCDASFAHAAAQDLVSLDSVINISGKAKATLIAGSLLGCSVHAIPEQWPMFMVDVEAEAGAELSFPLEELHEVAVYVVDGRVAVGAEASILDRGEAAVFEAVPKKNILELKAGENARVAIFGGLPFPEERHIVWNYVASSKTTIKSAIREWDSVIRGQGHATGTRFARVAGENNLDSIPMPPSFNAKVQ